jgi:hypothetical protein
MASSHTCKNRGRHTRRILPRTCIKPSWRTLGLLLDSIVSLSLIGLFTRNDIASITIVQYIISILSIFFVAFGNQSSDSSHESIFLRYSRTYVWNEMDRCMYKRRSRLSHMCVSNINVVSLPIISLTRHFRFICSFFACVILCHDVCSASRVIFGEDCLFGE